jgi:cephalosporin hydroxylase
MSAKKTYLECYKEHKGLVSHKWIHYFFIYDRIFKRFLEKDRPIKMLEIGVQNGGSLEIWKKYLPQCSIVHGVDIDERCRSLKFSEGIFFHLGNATDGDFMEKEFDDTQFDVIIDDGSHICEDVIQTFKFLFPRMKSGGCYVVEDIHASYWEEFGGGGRKGSIEYFKKLIDYGINRDYFRQSFWGKLKNKLCKQRDNDLEILKNISQISFFDSICAIDKFYEPKGFSFKNVISGEVALVNKEPAELRITVNDRQNEINKTEKLFCG